jgi:hypothetical protein
MKVHDVPRALDEVRKRARWNPRGRANADFGLLNDYAIGPGRASSQRRRNCFTFWMAKWKSLCCRQPARKSAKILRSGNLFVVPPERWHQLNASDGASILFASPPESGAERTRDDPRGSK